MPDLPENSRFVDWLRANVCKKPPSKIARWFGEAERYSYDIGVLSSVDSGFFKKSCLFNVYGERGMFPFPALPSGSWGIFAYDGTTFLSLVPDDDSLDRLLQQEGRDLDSAEPERFAQFLCDVRLSDRSCHGHTVVATADSLRGFGDRSPPHEYKVNEPELRRVEGRISYPTVVRREVGGWEIVFTTVYGWKHNKRELGVERVEVSEEFRVHRRGREILSKRIFSKTPALRY